MSNSEYLKRHAAPRSWLIDRKERAFISKPNPGAHPIERALPLGLILQSLGVGKTSREVKKAMLANEIIVDGRRVKDHRLPVGLFDTVEVPTLKLAQRMGIDLKGRLALQPIAKDVHHKPCRIVGKTIVKGNKVQLNLIDSRNLLVPKDSFKVGDTLIIDVPKQTILKHLKLEAGAKILITSGRYVGQTAKVSGVEGDTVTFTINETTSQTNKEHVYVIP